MKISLAELLACPVCYDSLSFEGTSSIDRLLKGFLRCPRGHLYQVKDEIPILKDPKLSQGEFVWKVEFPNLQKYDDVRRRYASYISREQKEADRALMNKLVEEVSTEELVLDVASGMGRLLLTSSQQLKEKINLIGTDVDEKPLRGAKVKLTNQKGYSKVSLCVMDGKHLALKSQKFSCVTSYFGLDNIPDTNKAFREVSRVLKPRGRLIFATLWLKEGSKSLSIAEKLGFEAITTESRLVRTLEDTGFEFKSTEVFYSGKWARNPMDRIPIEGDWFAHTLVTAQKA